MRISKRTLAAIEMPYAVEALSLGGRTHFLAATQSHGPCLLFSPPDWRASVVWEGPGGAMRMAPVPGRDGAFLAVEGFFPIFQSDGAGIVYAEAGASPAEPWHVRRVLDLPFVHRIATVYVGAEPYLVASTLCGGKAFRDDWSQPGAVYAGPIPPDATGNWALQPILTGITKNHGLHVTRANGHQAVLIAGHEGVFRLQAPVAPGEPWPSERLIDRETSDVFAADLDEDGTAELLAIEPFHGDTMAIYREQRETWERVLSMPATDGHAIWSGSLLGAPAVVVGSRGGNKELALLRPQNGDLGAMERRVIDAGTGPIQVAVAHERERELILSANDGTGDIALYELTAG